jgi:hypothetical protein
LRELSKTVDNWEPPEKLRAAIRGQMEWEKERRKAGYDERRHDNLKYSVGEVVVMSRAPYSTGESTKLQNRYRGPLVVTEVLPSDIYRVCELDDSKSSHFATTAHVSQLKCWKMVDEEEEEDPAPENTELEDEGQVIGEQQETGRQQQQVRRKPAWLRDYVES